MRRLFPDSARRAQDGARSRQAVLLRRLPCRWAATALVVTAVTLLAPGGNFVTASRPAARPASGPVHPLHHPAMTERAPFTPSRLAGPG
ncbi:MAG: hypothetical protein WAK82_06650 [Streptosporangiaceae bacterium]